MKYSLLIPTRERINKLEDCIKSIYETTHQKKNIEILIGCDFDDMSSFNMANTLKERYQRTMDIKVFQRKRSEFLNRDYYNWLAEKASGDMIWVLADDLKLIVNGWDTEVTPYIENHFKTYPDKVLCVSMRDNTPPPSHRLPKFPCFPMFSKEAIKACGFLLSPNTPNWGADYIAYVIYHPLNRLMQMHEKVYIIHISLHTKLMREADKTGKRIGTIFNRLKMIPEYNTDNMIAQECPKIREKINSYIVDFNFKQRKKQE